MLIVGLAPAANGTNRTGRMFTGDRSGDWLYASLHRAGFAALPTWSRHAGDGQRLARRAHRRGRPLRAAGQQADDRPSATPARPGSTRELELAAPTLRVVVALGSIAWDAALARVRRVGARPERPDRGSATAREIVVPTLRAGRAMALLGSYHVSQQNTFTGRLTEPMLDEVLAQAAALSALADHLVKSSQGA